MLGLTCGSSADGRRSAGRTGCEEDDEVTREELHALPTLVDVTTAGEILGVGRALAYQLVRTGQWPTPVIRMGRLIKVPTGPLLRLLDLQVPSDPQRAAPAVDSGSVGAFDGGMGGGR